MAAYSPSAATALFFISGGDALLPQPFRGFGHIAIGFFQCLLTVHHASARFSRSS